MFHYPVTHMKTTILSASKAVVAASEAVQSKQICGRHAITIAPKSGTIYIGGPDVSSTNGLPIASGTTFTVPVSKDRVDQVYVVGGDVVLTEWF